MIMKTHQIKIQHHSGILLNSTLSGVYNKIERVGNLIEPITSIQNSTTLHIRSIAIVIYLKFVFGIIEVIKRKI
jgi:hypothetical protein